MNVLSKLEEVLLERVQRLERELSDSREALLNLREVREATEVLSERKTENTRATRT